MVVFTVFTPTYNRAHLLRRVYESLLRQTFPNFEWLIVDDGSTDDTKAVVESWQRESKLLVRYIQQEHGHKKVAFNRGVREANGELFLPWDSDDGADPRALETFYQEWMNIPEEKRAHFVGVCGLCVNEEGEIVGSRFPADILDSDSLEVHYRYRVKGEKWGFSRTDVLRQQPFPEQISGHVPEGVVWSAIAKRYKTRFINQPLRIYYAAQDSVTQEGRTAGGAAGNAEGHAFWARSVLENELQWFFYKPFWFLKMAANYTRFRRHLPSGSYERTPAIGGVPLVLVLAMWPLGYALFRRDLRR